MTPAAVRQAALREHRKRDHLCIQCGAPAAFLSVQCQGCLDRCNHKAKLRAAEARRARRARLVRPIDIAEFERGERAWLLGYARKTV